MNLTYVLHTANLQQTLAEIERYEMSEEILARFHALALESEVKINKENARADVTLYVSFSTSLFELPS